MEKQQNRKSKSASGRHYKRKHEGAIAGTPLYGPILREMNVINALKKAVRVLHIKGPVIRALRVYGRLFPTHVVARRGIKYRLDLREVVDFATYFGGWEPETIKFIDERLKSGDVVIEVGANVGVQTLQIAKRVYPTGHVYAFEPTRFALSKLADNLALNPALSKCVTVKPNLVTDHELDVPLTGIKSSYRVDLRDEASPEQVGQEDAVCLDAFVEAHGLTKVDLLKIDVDGYDFKVLRGARRTIESCRPEIYIELDEAMLNRQGDSVRDILDLLFQAGYEGCFARDGRRLQDITDTIEEVRRTGHINAIFRHAARAPV